MRSFLFILTLVFVCSANATLQIEDTLNYAGKDYPIEQTPLSSVMPEATIIELLNLNEMCSASWRGYKAKWKIDDKLLYLTEIKKNPCTNGGNVVPLKVLFPDSMHSVKAIWFSGKITSLTGKSWSVEKKLESGRTTIVSYKYEVEVFVISEGVLVEKRTEVVSYGQ